MLCFYQNLIVSTQVYHIELINDNDTCHFYYDGKQFEKGWPGERIVQNLTPMSIPLRDVLISPSRELAASMSPLYFADNT